MVTVGDGGNPVEIDPREVFDNPWHPYWRSHCIRCGAGVVDTYNMRTGVDGTRCLGECGQLWEEH